MTWEWKAEEERREEMEKGGLEWWGGFLLLGPVREGDETYLFLFIALLAQVLASSGHLGAAHSVFLGREMFFSLRFCIDKLAFEILLGFERQGPRRE